MRTPRISGVGGGVGTTTVAVGLRARDSGVYHGGPVDVLVCRSTATSVNRALAAINAAPGAPVLAVVADGPWRTPAVARARLTMVEPHVTAIVAVPYVDRWREIDAALEQAHGAMSQPAPPKWLRAWIRALAALATAVMPLLELPAGLPSRGAPPPAARHAASPLPVVPPLQHPSPAGTPTRPSTT